MLSTIKYIIFPFFIIISCVHKLSAQLNVSYNISCLASTNASNYNSSSIALTINNCLQVSNGLSKFLPVNHNEFVNRCLPILSDEIYHFLVYPNPFKSFINIKSEVLIKSSDNILINVYTAVEGKLVFTMNVPNQNILYSGIQIMPHAIASGSYILDINMNNLPHLFKIVKID